MIIVIFYENSIGALEQQLLRDEIRHLCSLELLTFDNGHEDETVIAILILLDILENDWYLS